MRERTYAKIVDEYVQRNNQVNLHFYQINTLLINTYFRIVYVIFFWSLPSDEHGEYKRATFRNPSVLKLTRLMFFLSPPVTMCAQVELSCEKGTPLF